MSDPEPEYRAIIPTLKYSHAPEVGGMKCVLCGSKAEYKETNPHIRKVGPKRTTWLCFICHTAIVLGEPVPEPSKEPGTPQEDPVVEKPKQDQKNTEPSQNGIKRDHTGTETIQDGPISENNGTEPEPNRPENGTALEPPRPPTPVPCQTHGEYLIPDVLGDVSLGIERDAVGFTYTFYRQGSPIGSQKTSKTPPWLSSKVVTDISAALFNACPDLGKVYTKEYFRETLGDVFKTLQNTIQTNPQAAALLMPPAITHILSKVDRVAVTLFKDGLGGGEPVYEIFTGKDEDEDPRTVTLSLGDITAETPALFKRRWTSVFVTDFLEMNREDWVSLRRALIERAEVREVEHTGAGDALISDLLEELRYKTFTEMNDIWKADTNSFLLCENTAEGWLVYVTAAAIHGFLKRQDLDPSGKTPYFSKELRRRGITTGVSKTIRVEKGTQGTVRVWTFKGTALDFREDMLYERANTPDPQVVTGENFVTGEKDHTLTQTENGRNTEPGPGGV